MSCQMRSSTSRKQGPVTSVAGSPHARWPGLSTSATPPETISYAVGRGGPHAAAALGYKMSTGVVTAGRSLAEETLCVPIPRRSPSLW